MQMRLMEEYTFARGLQLMLCLLKLGHNNFELIVGVVQIIHCPMKAVVRRIKLSLLVAQRSRNYGIIFASRGSEWIR